MTNDPRGPEPPADPTVEDVVDAFVEFFNAKDWDEVATLLAPDGKLNLGAGVEGDGVVDSLVELALSHPGMLLTRGERGDEPVAVAWIPDGEGRPWVRVGYFSFSTVDAAEHPLIEYLEYSDVPEDGAELLAEEPSADEVPEWDDWNEWEEGAPSAEPGETEVLGELEANGEPATD